MGSRNISSFNFGPHNWKRDCRRRSFRWVNNHVRFLQLTLIRSRTHIVSYSLLSTTTYPFGTLPFSSLILIEPGMLSRELWRVVFKEPTLFNRIMEMTRRGKNNWPSREAARQWFSKRNPWKTWDAQAFDLMIVSHYPLSTTISFDITPDRHMDYEIYPQRRIHI